jgi:hypothetical protein
MERRDPPPAEAGPGEIQETPKTGAVALAVKRSGADERTRRVAVTDTGDAAGGMG